MPLDEQKSAAAPFMSRSFSLRSWALAGALLSTLPIIALVAWIVSQFADSERVRLENGASRTAHEIAATIDREHAATLALLQTLARNRYLLDGDFANFYNIIAVVTNLNVVLRDTSGQQLVNTRLPWGTPLPRANHDLDSAVIATKKPAFSGVFIGAVTKRPLTLVLVPVVINGEARYLLSASIEPQHILDLARNFEEDQQMTAVFDRDHRYIARSQRHEEYLGKPGPADLFAKATAQEGTWRGPNIEGLPFFSAYVRTDMAGWLVSVGMYANLLEAPLRRSLWLIGFASFVVIGATAAAGLFFAWRIARAMAMVRDMARELEDREPVGPAETGVREADEIGRALARTSMALRGAEGWLDLAAEAGDVGSWEWIVGTDRMRWSPQFRAMLGYEPSDAPSMEAKMARVHPADRAAIMAEHVAVETAPAGPRPSIQHRIISPDGDTRWIERRTALVVEGRRRRVIGVAVDITERREHAEQLKHLMAELSHRSKNLLAVVQAIVRQTARHAGGIEDFQDQLAERIAALAGVHDLLVREDWRGAPLRDVVEKQIQPFAPGGGGQFSVEGPDMRVSASGAQHLSLALHELATNAVKHGSLSKPGGKVAIRWSLAPCADGHAQFAIEWEESGGPPVTRSERKGFGTFVLERMVSAGLHGHSSLEHRPEGLRWSLTTEDSSCWGGGGDPQSHESSVADG